MFESSRKLTQGLLISSLILTILCTDVLPFVSGEAWASAKSSTAGLKSVDAIVSTQHLTDLFTKKGVWQSKTLLRYTDWLASLEDHGFGSKPFGMAALASQIKHVKNRSIGATPEFTQQLQSSLNQAVMAIHRGLTSPRRSHPHWYWDEPSFDSGAFWQRVAGHNWSELEKILKDSTPQDPRYLGLQDALVEWKALAAKGDWEALPVVGKKWVQGDRGAHIAQMRTRLQRTGELGTKDKAPSDPELFDEGLKQAVQRFQKQHGLNADGVVGEFTRKEMSVPPSQRVAQIRANMERWRWLPRTWDERFLWANIPDYTLQVFEKGQKKLSLRTVVGNPQWSTPQFRETLKVMVLNPQWSVPPDILKKEMLPAMQKDPQHLTGKNFKVFQQSDDGVTEVDPALVDWAKAKPGDFAFRQQSGGGNALGKIKFLFPNRHSIYFHDTPSRYLFSHDQRAFSHGCVRVDQPFQLAQAVLQNKRSAEDLKKEAEASKEKAIKVQPQWPVYLVYLTAWHDATDGLQLRSDPYGLDRALIKLLP